MAYSLLPVREHEALERAITKQNNRNMKGETMNKTLAILAAGALLTPALMANTVTLVHSPFYPDEITLLPSAGTVDLTLYASVAKNYTQPGTFETFCLEKNENFTLGPTFTVTPNDAAVYGGNNMVNNPGRDPISVGTAWLYHQFQLGTLSQYDYTGATRGASSQALQQAIWWLEGEVADPSNYYSQLVVGKFGTAATAMADNAGQIGVGVLNLWVPGQEWTTAGARQDVLVCIPDGGLTVSLLGLGMMLLGTIRRKIA
jgi:hypothetical protein